MSKMIKLLSLETGLSEFTIRRIIQTAPQRYKVFYIPKRNGAKRRIAQPSKEVKVLQRLMVDKYLRHLPVHRSATAYSVGSSIVLNAKAHASNGPILKMDFRDFFPSIKKSDWVLYCKSTGFLTEADDIEFSARLFFQKQSSYRTLRLAIGAPSSPILSNILMYKFDELISESLKDSRVVYTRYADDLTFSAPRIGFLKGIQTLVRKSLRLLEFPKIKVNETKTVIVSQKYKRVVTGIVLTHTGSISVGKAARRKLRASIHHAIHGRLDRNRIRQLAGMISYVNSVEPEFVCKMRNYYGEEAMAKIMHGG